MAIIFVRADVVVAFGVRICLGLQNLFVAQDIFAKLQAMLGMENARVMSLSSSSSSSSSSSPLRRFADADSAVQDNGDGTATAEPTATGATGQGSDDKAPPSLSSSLSPEERRANAHAHRAAHQQQQQQQQQQKQQQLHGSFARTLAREVCPSGRPSPVCGATHRRVDGMQPVVTCVCVCAAV